MLVGNVLTDECRSLEKFATRETPVLALVLCFDQVFHNFLQFAVAVSTMTNHGFEFETNAL